MAKFKGLIKVCESCGSEFKVPQSQGHVRTCSTECGYKIRRVANKKENVELTCEQCGNKFFERQCHAGRRVFCSRKCMFSSEKMKAIHSKNASKERNPHWRGGASRVVVSSTGLSYRRGRPEVENERGVRRKRAKKVATPKWANIGKILVFYRKARQLSKATGVAHHVDHIVPLTSSLVCGLHCEFNLQVIPASDNLRKHNRSWPNMP